MPAQDVTIVLRVDDKGTRVIKQFATQGSSALRKLEGSAKKASGGLAGLRASAKASFTTFATGLLPVMGIMGAISMLRRQVSDMIRTGREFETSMANVATLTRLAQEEVEAMRDAVANMSPTLGRADEMAQGLYQTISAGIPIGEGGAIAIAFLGVAAKTAIAGLSDMDATVRLLASTMNAYSLQMGTAEEAIKSVKYISDALFGTVKYGITTMKELVAGLPRLTSTAAALRIPIEQVGAALATMTAKGLTTRIAVLSLNRLLLSFVKTTPAARKAAEQLGLSFDTAGVVIGGLPSIIEQISKAMIKVSPEVRKAAFESKDLGEAQKLVANAMGLNIKTLAKLFPNVASLRAALMLTGDQGERFKEVLVGIEEGLGTMGGSFSWTEAAMKRHMSTASFWMKTFGNIFDQFKVKFFLGITESFRTGITSTEDFQKKVDDWARTAGEKVRKFATDLGEVIKKGVKLVSTIGKVAKQTLILIALWKGMKMMAPFMGAQRGAAGFMKSMLANTKQMKLMSLAGGGMKGALSKVGLIGAAAFAGWQIGKIIGRVTGLDKKIQKVTESLVIKLGIVKDYNKEVLMGLGHAQAAETRELALAKASELTGEKITHISDAKRVLYREWLKTGDLGDKTLDSWIVKMENLGKVDAKDLKTKKEKAVAEKNAFDILEARLAEQEKLLAKNTKAWDAWGKKATSSLQNVYDYVGKIREDLGKFELKFEVAISKDFEARAKETTQKILDIETELYEKTVVEKMKEVDKKLYENKKYFDGLRKIIEEEKAADRELYASKVKELDDYYTAARENLNKRMEDAKREIGIVQEIERAKLAIKAATNEWEVDEAMKTAETRLNRLHQTGLKEIADSEVTMRAKLESEKEGMDARVGEYDKTLAKIDKAEEVSVANIIEIEKKKRDMIGKINKEIEADWIRSIASLIKGGGNFFDAMKGVFTNMRDIWVDKTAQMIVDGKGLWQSLKTGFQGLSKSISGTFEGIGGALSKFGAGTGGILGGLTSGVGGLITKFAGLAGPIGAAISIGSKLPIIGTAVKKITSVVTGLLSKIPLIGGLFKKKKTEAQKAAEAAAKAEEIHEKAITVVIASQRKLGTISRETAETIQESAKSMGRHAAVSKHFLDVIRDVGVTQKNVNNLWKRASQIIRDMEKGTLDTAAGAKVLGESFTELLEGTKALGQEGSKAMTKFIKKIRKTGTEVKEVTDYINSQLGVTKTASMSAAQGLEAMAKAALPAIGAITERMSGLKKEISETTTQKQRLLAEIDKTEIGSKKYDRLNEQLKKTDTYLTTLEEKLETSNSQLSEMGENPAMGRLERQTMAVFNAMIANGASYAEAIASIGGTLDAISKKHTELGTTAGAGIQELLKIREVTEANKELFDAIEGNKAVMDALANTGSMTQQSFTDSAKEAQSYYDELKKAGLSSNQALAQMAPTLERIDFLSKEHGLSVDKTTQGMIAQAREQGLMEKEQLSMQDTMLGGFGHIIRALGGDIPRAFRKAMGRMKDFGEEGERSGRRVEKALYGSGIVGALEILGERSDEVLSKMRKETEKVATSMGTVEGVVESVKGTLSAVEAPKLEIGVAYKMPPMPAGEEFRRELERLEGAAGERVEPFISDRGEYVKPEEARAVVAEARGVAGVEEGKVEGLLQRLIQTVKESKADIRVEPTIMPLGDMMERVVIKSVPKLSKKGRLNVHPNASRQW